MIDLHSHLLPGVDDGSRTVEQSVSVLRAMAQRGITDLCLTPHLSATRTRRGIPGAHDVAFAALCAAAPTDVRLHRGVEMMLDCPLPDSVDGRQFTVGGTRYLLVEFTRQVSIEAVANGLRHLVSRGLIPLVAHPERYACCTVELVHFWREIGARMALDATTLLRPRTRGDRARAILAAGLADVVAGDNHGDDRFISVAYEELVREGGGAQAEQLAVGNPAAILADRPTEPVPGFRLATSLLQRFKSLLERDE